MKKGLEVVYRKLAQNFGPQHWWPAKSPFEVMVGAVLTQNTNWSNVEKAIANLKKAKVLTPEKLYKLPTARLAKLIRPAGYYNIKAQRLRNFLKFFFHTYGGKIGRMALGDLTELRQQLLSVCGIGPETADSILLYALDKPIFVVDAYTKRILSRHKLVKDGSDYHQVQDLFMHNLKTDVRLFNEYHALLVKLGKDFCRKNNPRCSECPLRHPTLSDGSVFYRL
jgi:endonuclease-3 related protein